MTTSAATARVAIVGAGRWSGAVHIPALLQSEGVMISTICDTHEQRARELADTYGIRSAVTSVDAAIETGIDCAIVATPHDQHFEPVMTLLRHGIDVLVEKPMALRGMEAWQMVDESRRTGSRLHVGYTFLHSPLVSKLRRELESNSLGTLRLTTALFATTAGRLFSQQTEAVSGEPVAPLASTYADPARGGGQLFTQVTHAASLMLWLLQSSPSNVMGLESLAPSKVDLVDTLSFRAGQTLVNIASAGTIGDLGENVEQYYFFGDKGHAELDTKAGFLRTKRYGADAHTLHVTPAESNPVYAPAAELVAAWREHREPFVGGEIGAKTVSLLEEVKNAISRHSRLDLRSPRIV